MFPLTAAEKAEVVANCDHLLKQVFEAIRQLMAPPPEPKKRPIGFVTPNEK
jgi:hypothetical protein